MPQLDTSTYLTQIFWLIVTFLSFWLIMDKIIIPRIAEMIENRKRKCEEYIIKAEEVNKKALDALKRYKETLAVAKADMAEKISQNEKDLKHIIEEKETAINRELQCKIAENESKLAKEKAEILSKTDELAEEITLAILEKLNLKTITKEDIVHISRGE